MVENKINYVKDFLSHKLKNPKHILGYLWLLISFLLTRYTVAYIKPKPIDLGDLPSCSQDINKCDERRRELAKKQFQKNLTESLETVEQVKNLLPILKLIPSKFELSFRDEESELQGSISEPQQIFHLTSLDLICRTGTNNFTLRHGKEIKLGKNVNLVNTEKGIEQTVVSVNELLDNFHCNSKEGTYRGPVRRTVAPNGIFSINILRKPTLLLRPTLAIFWMIFLGYFAIIGGLLALVKQFIEVYRKNISYFLDK